MEGKETKKERACELMFSMSDILNLDHNLQNLDCLFSNLSGLHMLYRVCVNQTLFLAGLYYTSATCASAVQNLVPVFTFGISACLG